MVSLHEIETELTFWYRKLKSLHDSSQATKTACQWMYGLMVKNELCKVSNYLIFKGVFNVNRLLQAIAFSLFVFGVSGCSSKGDIRDGSVAAGNTNAEAIATAPLDAGQIGALADSAKAGSDGPVSSSKIIYFGFNSFTVDTLGRELLAAHAAHLSSNPALRVRLEGHGDERGSREYNIALGDRRAQAVKQVLSLQGVNENQISIVSFGEEKPVDYGHIESAWRQNRRVEIAYAAN